MKKLRVHLSGKDRLAFFTDLSTMLTAGIPILEALESLQTDAKGNVKKVVNHLHASVLNGEPLSRSMRTLPNAFDPITVNLIHAAETGGTLEETLADLVQITKREMAFSSSLRNTMIYPLFVSVLFMAIIVLMLTFVVPRISKVFLSLRVNLPATTTMLFKASDYFLANWPFIIAGTFVGIFLLVIFISYQKRLIVRMLLSLPGLSALGLSIDLTRMTRSMSLLIRAGIPLDEALELTEHVVQKRQIINIIKQMRKSTESGEPLSTSLRHAKRIIPPIMARSMETAERSGTLEKTLQNLSEYFDDQVQQRLKVVSSMIEPIMIVIVGIMVGTLMVTIMAPMYSLFSQIKK